MMRKAMALLLSLSMVMGMFTAGVYASAAETGMHVSKTATPVEGKSGDFRIDLSVPGDDTTDIKATNDEVIIMVDGSYSGDDEWPTVRQAIIDLGEEILGGYGNTRLTLMTFGMGDNIVVEGISSATQLEKQLPELPGGMLYGRSSTNCEAGFTGVMEYIEKHETLNDAYVIYITDGAINTDETPRDYSAWQTSKLGFSISNIVGNTVYTEMASVAEGKNHSNAFLKHFGSSTQIADQDAFIASLSVEQMIAYANDLWTEVFAFSGMSFDGEHLYPVSDAERAFLDYEAAGYAYVEDIFYYTTFRNATYSSYPDRWTRTPQAATKLAAMDQVEHLYMVDTNAPHAWMNPENSNDPSVNVVGENVSFSSYADINNIAGTVQSIAEEISITPYNDVVVTDYMSKWVNLDPNSIAVIDNITGETIWTAAEGSATDDAPVIIEEVSADAYAAGGADVEGNTNGTIYKLTWNVKHGALRRSDSFTLTYLVSMDVEESGYQHGVQYPTNGNTDITFTDENGEEQTDKIDVPTGNIPPVDMEFSFKAGAASHVSFFYIDADGNVIYDHKTNIDDETSVTIPYKEGYTRAVFIKQAKSGMIWLETEVDEEILDAVIESVKENDPAYKGHDAVCYGQGDHTLTYRDKKKTKTVVYSFD